MTTLTAETPTVTLPPSSGAAPAGSTAASESSTEPVVDEIFQYVKAGKRTAQPRTALHSHFRALTQVAETGVTEITKAVASQAGTAARFDQLDSAVTQNRSATQALGTELSTLANTVKELSKFLPGGAAGGTAGGVEGTFKTLSKKQKRCLQAINQVEDLLLDKAPKDLEKKRAENNAELVEQRKSPLYKEASEALASIGEEERWKRVSYDSIRDEEDRVFRVFECDRLRGIVLRNSQLNSDSTETPVE